MKRFPGIFAILLALFLFSCSNEPAKEEAKTSDTGAAVAAAPEPVKPVFNPFKIVVVQHKVKDFAKSQAGYFNSDSLRMPFGITHFLMGRDLRDTNMVFLVEKIEDVDKAKSYFNQPKVKDAMMKAGVKSAPGYNYGVMVRFDDAAPETGIQLGITHHVKDYDAWLKVFDAEGTATRAANGMIDRGIARNFYDSNTVSIFFAVSDSAKARARVNSPEIKKVMTDAGVDGTPTIRFYKAVK